MEKNTYYKIVTEYHDTADAPGEYTTINPADDNGGRGYALWRAQLKLYEFALKELNLLNSVSLVHETVFDPGNIPAWFKGEGFYSENREPLHLIGSNEYRMYNLRLRIVEMDAEPHHHKTNSFTHATAAVR